MSSLINFLNPNFKPSVESEAISEDGFTAANLVANDASQMEQGFMCVAACKPPVEVVFNLPKAVDMKVIKLWPSIGALRSTAFELHGRHDDTWERVAFVKDLGLGVDSVTFCYQSDYSSRSTGQPQSEKVFFFRSACKILASTNSVKVVIRATEGCPPVLRKVEMWGLPARSMEKADKELVKSIWSKISDPFGWRHAKRGNVGQRSMRRRVPQLKEQSSLYIPEEFLDCITWELMILPTVLPSGKVVDQSTIDKHAEAESKWHRHPSDPFTGLEYNAQRKAVLNVELKARIEEFLLEHSGHFEAVSPSRGSSRLRCRTSQSAADTYSRLSSARRQQQLKKGASGTSSSPPAKIARLSPHGTASCASSASASISTSTSFSSIDQAFQPPLQKTSRFSASSELSNCSPSKCINCRSAQFRYEIRTCRHLVCQDCLVKLSRDQMCVCKVSFLNADIKRYKKLIP
ncbi:hypothetical protein KR054_005800 [Drosophila jambulina]|nr:hypothetical protein KR054_005800 [Drosophila jambulina]